MKKLFIFQENNTGYRQELEHGFGVVSKGSGKVERKNIASVYSDYLVKSGTDVIVSNGLPEELYAMAKRLKIVTVTLDAFSEYHTLADILIDYANHSNARYFTGGDYSLLENKDFESEFDEITNLIKKLEWDSNFWGFPVAYLSCRYLREAIVFRLEKFIKSENIKLIEYLCNCHDGQSVKIAENNGFNFVDIRLSFEKSLDRKTEVSFSDGFTVSLAGARDIEILKNIADNIYKTSRYFFDENFDREKVNEFYRRWVEKAVLGQYDDECYCLYFKGKVVGFCTVKYHFLHTASINLVGISKDYQTRGLARSLLGFVFNKLIDKGVSKILVVTQGRNYPAQRLYQRAGFLTKATELWYHKWI